MSTQVKTEVQSTTETEVILSDEAKAIMADTTVVVDRKLTTLMGTVDQVQLKVGGKWADLIQHCKDTLFAHLAVDYKELTNEQKEALALGKKVVLKTLLSMNKTESSAQSIRSYIIKMSKPEMAENLAKLKAGEITVRASRELGRKPQSAPSKSNEAKYREAINSAVRFAVALGITPAKFGDDAETIYNEYLVSNPDKSPRSESNETKRDAAKDKAEFKQALQETVEQVSAKK